MRYLFVFLLIGIVISCSGPAAPPVSAKEKFDAIEKIVGTANWELTAADLSPDTASYFYFSRVGDTRFNIYTYFIKNGDSVNSTLSTMIARNDSIVIVNDDNANDYPSVVKNITDSSLTIDESKLNHDLVYVKTDSLHIHIKDSATTMMVLKKTLPLAAFLVRKKYDFLHGTSYVDSAEVPPKGMRQ